MDWVTVIWSATAGFCLALAAVRFLVWLRSRDNWINLAFSLWVTAVAFSGAFELAMMHARTPDQYHELMRWIHIPMGLSIITYVWFIREYLQAGRLWLLWSICIVAGLQLIINFTIEPSIYFSEITTLQNISFWGETVAIPVGVRSPWVWIAWMPPLLILLFVVVASVDAWKEGRRRKVLVMGVAVFSSIIGSTSFTLLVLEGGVQFPVDVLFPSLFPMLIFGYELSTELFRAGKLSQQLTRTEDALKESEQVAQTLLNVTGDIGVFMERDGTILDVNDGMSEVLNATREELIGTCVFDRFPPEVAERRRHWANLALAANEPLVVEEFVEHSGKLFENTIYPMASNGHEQRKLVVIAKDLTERRQVERALQQSEVRLKEAQHIAHIGSWEWDVHADKTIWSDETYRMFGLDPALPPPDYNNHPKIYTPESWAILDKLVRHALEKGESYDVDLEYIRPDGTHGWQATRGRAIRDEQGHIYRLAGTVQDITARKQAEEALLKNRDYLQHLTNSIADAVFSVKLPERTIEWVNDSYQVLGYQAEDCVGKTTACFYVNSDEFHAFGELVADAIIQGNDVVLTEAMLRRKNGDVIPAEINATVFRIDGEPVSITAVIRDISKRKKSEVEQKELRHELAHYNRNLQMNELSASLAHEINQPLGAILNNASAAQELFSRKGNKENSDEIDEILQDIIKDANRAGDVIRNIRAMAQKEEITFEPLSINEVIENLCGFFRRNLQDLDIALELDLQQDLPDITGNRVSLKQVLMNLITNAEEAMQATPQRKLTINSRMFSPDRIIVCVSDTGTGISDPIRQKVFEQFFTTKTEGMGMGLRISRSIIEEHGGEIWFEENSEPGAIVCFSIPTTGEVSNV